jgi:hypothetical protein
MNYTRIAEMASVNQADVSNYMAWKNGIAPERLRYVTSEKQSRIEMVLRISQTQLIEDHLSIEGNTITPYVAMTEFGIGALSQRIGELNRQYEKTNEPRRIVNLNADKGGPGCYGEYKMEMTK